MHLTSADTRQTDVGNLKNAHLRPDGWKSVKGKEMAAVEILIPNVDCLDSVEFLLESMDLEEVTANYGGTGINMTAKGLAYR